MTAIQQILEKKVVAVVRLENYNRAVDVARALAAGGVNVLEFTLTGQGATDAVTATRKALGDSVCVGVGTVLSAEQAEAAIDAGAEFLVTPAVRKQVIAVSVKRQTLVLCGGMTPTELLEAHEAGAEMVKVFPAQLGGPKFIKDVLAPMPFLKMVPTGGVSPENARDYLAAGAVAVGIGGNLVSNKLVAAEAFEQITATAKACMDAIHSRS
ncbi:MAG: bifunctional 4-hydroxy-2-oxoglutarate aldolase/2-dehydro-3-deoxy-phosphogluconate aldolase [Anaerolineales bacterium]|nr:bifunctional 4-hydroxy-2-oxoglutarate aldolase/2-dehydro-3-deoxy-phosphogluconate aldolase [Anaerolineales bacterium]MBP6210649.1 bifunctional 4-hydroxy-2-oxoglutarate aldolase/2-dehydro-3-deoxy-phosphogluconate aldolase [Anaerolineales bacterium]